MYSGSIATWVSGETVTTSEQRGWMGQLWTAINTTTDQPSVTSANWQLDTPLRLSGLSIIAIHDPRDFLKTQVTGVTLIEVHTSRPLEVRLTGIRFMKYRPSPYLVITET